MQLKYRYSDSYNDVLANCLLLWLAVREKGRKFGYLLAIVVTYGHFRNVSIFSVWNVISLIDIVRPGMQGMQAKLRDKRFWQKARSVMAEKFTKIGDVGCVHLNWYLTPDRSEFIFNLTEFS